MVTSSKSQKINRPTSSHNPTGSAEVQRRVAAQADIKEFNDLLREKTRLNDGLSQNHLKHDSTALDNTQNAILANSTWGATGTSVPLQHLDSSESTPSTSAPISMELTLASEQATKSNQNLKTDLTSQIQQVIQRVISNSQDKIPKTWNIRLTIEGRADLVVTIDYRGGDQWCIGFNPDDSAKPEQDQHAALAEELDQTLLSNLQATFPALQITKLETSGHTI